MAADEGDVSQIITNFLLNTCRLCPRLSETAVVALIYSAMRRNVNRQQIDKVEGEHIPIITGSVAEFFTEPMLPLVSDVDVMVHDNTVLAIPLGYPPPNIHRQQSYQLSFTTVSR